MPKKPKPATDEQDKERTEQAKRVVEEYANDLRETLEKLRKLRLNG